MAELLNQVELKYFMKEIIFSLCFVWGLEAKIILKANSNKLIGTNASPLKRSNHDRTC